MEILVFWAKSSRRLNMRTRRILSILTICLIFVFIFQWNKSFTPDNNLCPACYGEDLCGPILQGHYEMKSKSNWKLISWILNVKNVYYITLGGGNYVMKKLAHDRELIEFDEILCQSSSKTRDCDISAAWRKIMEVNGDNVSAIIHENPDLFSESEVIKCRHPSILQLLLSKHIQQDRSPSAIPHFLTLLSINPEPLILKAFSGLTFLPKYKGSCGRAIVETHEGLPLSSFYNAVWKVRAQLAIQLLNIARHLSENTIRIYLTDTSADNFAVDSQGVLRIIDLESLVLVDSTVQGLDQEEHMNEGLGCLDCLSFTYESLCNHHRADHNYFAICKGLLSHDAFSPSMKYGLLHDIPKKVLQQHPDLVPLIGQCAQPNHNIRKKSAWSLQKMLENIVS